MTRAITYTLWLEEPCLLAAPGGDPNTESSLDYIPGGAVRGALAAAYLRAKGDDALFSTLFLSGRARFLNAYPCLNWDSKDEGDEANRQPGERLLPSSRAWATKKDDDNTIFNRLDDAARDVVEGGLPQGFKAPFFRLVPGTKSIQTPEIAHEIAVHTARNRQKGRAIENDADSALFRYRALARAQCFAGAVVVDDDLLATEVAGLLEGNSLLLGGSHMAGYGLVQVEEVRSHQTWREVAGVPLPSIAAGAAFVVYLTSPAIFYDPATGQPTSDILPFLPGGPRGYTIKHSFATMIWVGGFNKHRGLPLSQQWAVQMGSTWCITTERELTADDLATLEHSGIGVRREEGFGRLLFEPNWPATLTQSNEKQSIQVARMPKATVGASTGDGLLTRMNERMARRELDRRLALAVITKSQKTVRGHLSRSQFGRLMVRIRHEADTANFDGFLAYLKGTHERKSADDQFRRYSVEGMNFRDYLEQLAEKPETIWTTIGIEGEQIPHFGVDAYVLPKELAHDYTVRYISDLCRQLAKREVGQ